MVPSRSTVSTPPWARSKGFASLAGSKGASRRGRANCGWCHFYAGGGDNDVDLGVEVVEQISARHMVSANVGVIRAGEDMWRSLLEMQANDR